MNTVKQVLAELEKLGSEQTRKIYARHGIDGDVYGVKVGDLKKVAKKIKGNQELACELYDTGNHDAMYLAGIVADGSKMTKQQLESWAKASKNSWHCDYTVPGVATESKHTHSLALKWMKSRKEPIACAGWNTYVGLIATRADDELDLDEIKSLLNQIVDTIDDAPNGVRYVMNGFVIAVGTYVKPLLRQAKSTAKKIGKVEVDMGDTSCKVPLATEYIAKVESMGRVGKKRKTIKC